MNSSRLSSEGLRRYAGSTGWLVAERVVKAVLGLTVGVMVARYLGPHDYGLLNFAVSLIGLFTVFATLGLDAILVRELVRKKLSSSALLGTAIALRVAGATLLLLLITGALFWTGWQAEARPLILLVALSMLFQSFWLIDSYFQAYVNGRRLALPRMIAYAAGAVAKVSLIITHANINWFAAILAVESALISIGLFWNYRAVNGPPLLWKWQSNMARKLLRDGWPLILTVLAVSLYMKIDQVMLQQMIGPEAVGNYAVAVMLSEAWYFIPVAICASVFPALLSARSDQTFYEDRLQKLYDLMVFLGIVVACLISISADFIIQLLFGAQYQAAGTVLTIHVWAGVFVALGVASTRWLIAEGLERLSFYRTAIGAVVNIAFNLALIPLWGINGAALATLFSYCISVYLALGLVPQTRKNFLLATRAFALHRSLYRLTRSF